MLVATTHSLEEPGGERGINILHGIEDELRRFAEKVDSILADRGYEANQ